MIRIEPTSPSRSAGIVMEQDMIDALDELALLMEEGGVVPSRSEIARSLLWSAIGLVESPDPRAAELLRVLSDEGASR